MLADTRKSIRPFRYRFPAGSACTPYNALYPEKFGIQNAINNSITDSRRFFRSASTSEQSSLKGQPKSRKGMRRPNNQRKKSPKRLSNKRNHDRSKYPNTKSRRRSIRDVKKGSTLGSTSKASDGDNPEAIAPFASSLLDKWDGGNNREIVHPSSKPNTQWTQWRRNTTSQLKFRESRLEFCESVERYRRFWYPAVSQQLEYEKDSPGEDTSLRGNDCDWRTAMAFEHPDANLPWLKLTWQRVVESEDLFYELCSSYHTLFVSAAKCAQDMAYNSNDNPSERDILMEDCNELMETILPSWERIRRERAKFVEVARPKEYDDSDDESYRGHNKERQDEESVTNVMLESNQWVGWLKKMISGSDQSTKVDPRELFNRVTAHLDHRCAPNHYHYKKLIGHLYYHYLPLRRHDYLKPSHFFSKSESDEEGVSLEEYDGETNHGSYMTQSQYEKAMDIWYENRQEILKNRSKTMQYVLDQSLLPLTSNRNNDGTAPSKPHHTDGQISEYDDSSERVLTVKIIRLLLRSYNDMESLSAAQQADRVYHQHPKHRKQLLWSVTMSYLKVIISNNRHLARAGLVWNTDCKNTRDQKEFTQRNAESIIAAKRICGLVSSKHTKEAREFQHCSIVAFNALSLLSNYSRQGFGLKGYYNRVYSMGILKFGPKVWEALILNDDASFQKNKYGDVSYDDHSSRRRNRQTHHKTSLDTRASLSTNPPKLPIDLSQFLHSKDYKILSYLINIYSEKEIYHPRASRLLQVSLDLYSPDDLKESIKRYTFHKLLRSLSTQKRKLFMDKKKRQNPAFRPKPSTTDNSGTISDDKFSTALSLLNGMISDESWFPNEETFRILFDMIPYCENPGRDAERLRSKLEACRFLSGISRSSTRTTKTDADVKFRSLIFSEAPHILHPVEVSTLTLRAWLQSLQLHEGTLPKSKESPSQRALAILRAMEVESNMLAASLFHNERSNSDSGTEVADDRTKNISPTSALYALALEVCFRDSRSSWASLDAALEMFQMLQRNGMLLDEKICLAILRVVTDYSINNTSSTEDLHALNQARASATKRICEAIVEEDPCYWQQKPKILEFLQEKMSYLQLRHPELYEEHLAELLLDDNVIEAQK